MIVRDAARSLRQALASAQPFMDEMVVVDTGSTDGTRQIAQEMGARVVDFAWCDDFSAARNYSLAQATGDWIFWMDADDILPTASGQELRRCMEAAPNCDVAYWVTVEEKKVDSKGRGRIMGHAHAKLFPRHPAIRFRYRVHEQVAPAIRKAGLTIRASTALPRPNRLAASGTCAWPIWTSKSNLAILSCG
jgi:glycosyltransferase involved in cell wall biosynthesis